MQFAVAFEGAFPTGLSGSARLTGLTLIGMIPAAIVARTSRDDGADDPTNKGVNAGMIGVSAVSVLVWLGSTQG